MELDLQYKIRNTKNYYNYLPYELINLEARCEKYAHLNSSDVTFSTTAGRITKNV